jgi:hypothetical protein
MKPALALPVGTEMPPWQCLREDGSLTRPGIRRTTIKEPL